MIAVATSAQSAWGDTYHFSKGALIIPEQANFQSQCGMASAYGLIYRLLQSNQTGHFNETHPITVYIAVNASKASPNRCVPTNLNTPPSPSNSSAWNDGCDTSVITPPGQQPVVPVNYTTWPATGFYPNATVPDFTPASGTAAPIYNFNSITLNSTSGFTQINYMGGPFIIDAPDAQNVIQFIQQGDTYEPATDLAKFTTACSCSSVTSAAGNPGCHFVNMHQAMNGFDAQIARRINKTPPPFALLASSVLTTYLSEAGLLRTGTANHQDSGGCPTGNVSSCTLNGSTSAAPYHGIIYDQFQVSDLDLVNLTYPNGLLNQVDSNTGKPIYRVFWAPHWDAKKPNDNNALNSIAYFSKVRGNGIMTECASIRSYEGQSGTGGWIAGTHFLFTNGINDNGNLSSFTGPNCTDPNVNANNTNCMRYSNPSNVFSQFGDWQFMGNGGSVTAYMPGSSSAYQTATLRMVSSHATTASNDNFDFFDVGQADNNPNEATVLYTGGHDVSDGPVGVRIVLNSLMNLGAELIPYERSMSSPVAYSDPDAGIPPEIINGTYDAVKGYPNNPDVQTFNSTDAKSWVFPYTPGHLRAHSVTKAGGTPLALGESNLDSSTIWDANAKMPDPPMLRNLFTYFGGYPLSNPPLPGGGIAPHHALQVGWLPERVDGMHVNAACGQIPNPNCVDVMGYPAIVNATTYDDLEPGVHLVVGSDGLCDLQEAVSYSNLLNTGNDWSGKCNAHNVRTFLTNTPDVQHMLQQVLGYCYSSTSLTPTDIQCDDTNHVLQTNHAKMGGVLHSTPAVVGPSSRIADLPAGKSRPTVAYVGAMDGQLHAVYVGGGAGYTGPAGTLHFLNPTANSKFTTDYVTQFASGVVPAKGTELWSFLPASQLPWLTSNSARVDGAPVVQDVFVDMTGTGIREWHTVLVDTVGATGNEVFALDITNPLKPVLMWDVVGSLYKVGTAPMYSPVELLNATADPIGNGLAIKWIEPYTLFHFPPAADTVTGRYTSGVYNFSGLGGSKALALGQIRAGLEPVYAVYAATTLGNGGGANGLNVFALDVATGQKLWAWQEPYIDASRPSDNSVPAGVTLVNGAEGVSSVLAGDLEGRLWELDAQTGVNVNVNRSTGGCTDSAPCKYASFDTGSSMTTPQPISTNIGMAVIPSTIQPNLPLSNYKGGQVVIIGTGGEGFITDPTVSGRLHVLLYDTQNHVPFVTGKGLELDGKTPWTLAAAQSAAQASGVLQEPAPFPVVLAPGQRLFGEITTYNEDVFFASATGNAIDPLNMYGALGGRTYMLDLGLATFGSPTTVVSGSVANFGGFAVLPPTGGSSTTDVVGTELSQLNHFTLTTPPGSAPPPPGGKGLTYGFLDWLQRLLK